MLLACFHPHNNWPWNSGTVWHVILAASSQIVGTHGLGINDGVSELRLLPASVILREIMLPLCPSGSMATKYVQ